MSNQIAMPPPGVPDPLPNEGGQGPEPWWHTLRRAAEGLSAVMDRHHHRMEHDPAYRAAVHKLTQMAQTLRRPR